MMLNNDWAFCGTALKSRMAAKKPLSVLVDALGCGHLAAGLGAFATGLSALLTVVAVMAAALFSAAIASFSANAAKLFVQGRASTHKSRAEGAEIGTVSASLDAFRHHLNHIAVQTGINAVLAVYKAV